MGAAITEPVDTILLGRKLAEGFIPHWQNVAQNPTDPSHESGLKFTSTPKVVFSKTLPSSPWENTVLATRDLVTDAGQLKNTSGGDIIVYSGGSFAASLLQAGLIEELNLFINPVAIGSGMPLFKNLGNQLCLKLKESQAFDCGITLLRYEVGLIRKLIKSGC